MRRFALWLIILTFATFAFASVASADVALAEYDIFSDNGNWSASVFQHIVSPDYVLDSIQAETFAATLTGTVSSIQVDVTKAGTSTTPLTWTIRSTHQTAYNGLQPVWGAAGVLSTGTLASSDCPTSLTGWTTVLMTPVELQAGQTYALVASAEGTNGVYSWWSKYGGAAYSGRRLSGWISTPQQDLGSASNDLGFRIMSNNVPEPSSILALLTGGIGLIGLKLRRK